MGARDVVNLYFTIRKFDTLWLPQFDICFPNNFMGKAFSYDIC